jgi:hypothetical protein
MAKTIHVEPGSELARLLDEATEAPVVLERNGDRFRVEREVARADDVWADYDPQRALEAIMKAAGGWEGLIDAEEFKEYIRERRRTANRPSVKL